MNWGNTENQDKPVYLFFMFMVSLFLIINFVFLNKSISCKMFTVL
jgi:hypothetical protein